VQSDLIQYTKLKCYKILTNSLNILMSHAMDNKCVQNSNFMEHQTQTFSPLKFVHSVSDPKFCYRPTVPHISLQTKSQSLWIFLREILDECILWTKHLCRNKQIMFTNITRIIISFCECWLSACGFEPKG
jgi:hypothetical protein